MVQIVTDSSVLYTEEEAKAAGFDVVPLCVSVGDMDGRDLQINMEEFYGRIGKGEIPRSSQPPIGDVVEVYEKYQDADPRDPGMVKECGGKDGIFSDPPGLWIFKARREADACGGGPGFSP